MIVLDTNVISEIFRPSGDLAAAYYRCGDGNVGLIGPHPEADVTWFEDADLVDPDGDDWQHALPLVKRILS